VSAAAPTSAAPPASHGTDPPPPAGQPPAATTAARRACLVAALGAVAYLLLEPATADHAAQLYRAGLVRDAGLGVWDNGWFAGHHTPAYSVLSPALGALVGVRLAGALAAVAAAALFGLLAQRHWGSPAASVAAAWFAVGVVAMLVSGRLTFLLGVAVGLAAMLALQRAHWLLACALAALTTLASPVAGLFAAIAAVAWALSPARDSTVAGALDGAIAVGARHGAASPPDSRAPAPGAPSPHRDRRLRGAAVAASALVPAAALGALFPEGGTEPFVASAFWPALVAVVLVALALPARERTLRLGARAYALVLAAAFILPTALGGNATRLGALLAGPVLAGSLLAAGGRDRRAVLLAMTLPLAYWQLYPATRDVVRASGDPSTAPAYYAPLERFLEQRPGSFRVEVPFTENHWEAAHVAPRVPLARGWERQLDRRYGALFYDGTLTPATYRSWLDEHAVAYVAVPDAPLDSAGRAESRLVARGLPYLRPAWRNAHWRVYAVRRPAPLVAGAARTISLEPDGFAIQATRRGDALVRVRYTRWWSVASGRACLARGPSGMTRVRVLAPGTVRVQARLGGPACRR